MYHFDSMVVHFQPTPAYHNGAPKGWNVAVGKLGDVSPEYEFYFDSSKYPKGKDAEWYYEKYKQLKQQ